ncbi:MAG: hypothetical protein ACRDE2_08940 [Chitinophagaceae bacterium]
MKYIRNTIIWVILFSIAMGYLESAVVVYLRDIYYPDGFVFPLKSIRTRDLIVELFREAATLVMLVGIGILSGRTRIQRFAFFLMTFGILDIFYYIFLKIILGWPTSFMTWDILFLLPVLWVGPVLAPILLSLSMILFAAIILKMEKNYGKVTLPFQSLICLILGSLIVIFSFCEDPLRHLSAFNGDNPIYIPSHYLWWLFILGELVIFFGVYRLYISQRNQSKLKR